MAMVAIAGDDAVLADGHRRLETDGNRFLADVEVAEAADEAEPVKLAGALLEAADEEHLAVEIEELLLAWLEPFQLGRTLAMGRGRSGGGAWVGALGAGCLGHICFLA